MSSALIVFIGIVIISTLHSLIHIFSPDSEASSIAGWTLILKVPAENAEFIEFIQSDRETYANLIPIFREYFSFESKLFWIKKWIAIFWSLPCLGNGMWILTRESISKLPLFGSAKYGSFCCQYYPRILWKDKGQKDRQRGSNVDVWGCFLHVEKLEGDS